MQRRIPNWRVVWGMILLSLIAPISALATVSVVDDANHTVAITTPAQRIISLAPHATELLYAAGAGTKLVGVSDYSDYPPQAKRIPSIGSSISLDLERIIALKPDLIVAWGSGNAAAQIAKLSNLGIPVFVSEPHDFETVASSIERLAQLAGTMETGRTVAEEFRARQKKIAATYQKRPTVRVFYQIWRDPLMTLNDHHMVSAAIRMCGGQNIFGKLPQLTPTIGIEAVLKEDPEAIFFGKTGKDESLASWQRFPKLTAVAHSNLFPVDSDLLARPGPRILDGTDVLCKQLDLARGKRK